MTRTARHATWMILAAALVTLGGCGATYVPLDTPRTLMAEVAADGAAADGPNPREKLETAMTDQEIAELLDVDVRAKWPTGLAVARLTSTSPGNPVQLGQIDSTEMAGWEKVIAGQSDVTGVNPVTALSHPSHSVTLRSLRVAAARMNCELLLVYLQADSAVENRNDASALYWTGVGLWAVPGHEVQHKTLMQAVLIHCRTGMMLGTATGDSHIKRLCPWAFTDNRRVQLAEEAPVEAIAKLQDSATKLLARTTKPPQVSAAP